MRPTENHNNHHHCGHIAPVRLIIMPTMMKNLKPVFADCSGASDERGALLIDIYAFTLDGSGSLDFCERKLRALSALPKVQVLQPTSSSPIVAVLTRCKDSKFKGCQNALRVSCSACSRHCSSVRLARLPVVSYTENILGSCSCSCTSTTSSNEDMIRSGDDDEELKTLKFKV